MTTKVRTTPWSLAEVQRVRKGERDKVSRIQLVSGY